MSYPESVKSIVLTKIGDFDAISQTEVPFPSQGKDEIVIKVHYGGINFIDNYFRTGIYPVAKLPSPVGEEGSGVIIALPSDHSTISDPEYVKRGFKVGGKVVFTASGSFTEYVSFPWAKVFAIPENVSLRTAASVHTQGLTALSFAEEAYNIKAGDTILIHTVAGGFGLLLTQLAKLRGATVIGTTSTAEKAEIAKANGADHVILYRSEDTAQRVLEITNGEGVHGIFDGVGKDTYEIDFKVIRRKGTIIFVGNASGVVPPISPFKLVEKNIKIARPTVRNYLLTPEEGRRYTTELYDLVASQKLNVRVHGEYPFTAEGVQQAERDLTGGKTVGKLLVKIANDE